MDAAVKLIRTIRLVFIASVFLYAIIGEAVGREAAPYPNVTTYFGIALMAVITMIMITVLRRIFVVPAEALLAKNPDDSAALMRWRTGYIITYGLSETVALYGFALRFLGFTLSQVVTFYVVSLILLMFFGVQRPSNAIG